MAMADRRSRLQRLGPLAAGTASELSGRSVRILATFDLGVDYQSDGTLVMSDATLGDIFPDRRGASKGDDDGSGAAFVAKSDALSLKS